MEISKICSLTMAKHEAMEKLLPVGIVLEAAKQKELDQAAKREKDKKTKEGEKMVPVKLRMSGLKLTPQISDQHSSTHHCISRMESLWSLWLVVVSNQLGMVLCQCRYYWE